MSGGEETFVALAIVMSAAYVLRCARQVLGGPSRRGLGGCQAGCHGCPSAPSDPTPVAREPFEV